MKFYLYDESQNLIDWTDVVHDQLLEVGEEISGVLRAPRSSTVEVIRILSISSDE